MEQFTNRTFKLRDPSNSSATSFHAIVIAEDDRTVTYVEHGHPSVGAPRAHFAEMIVEETEHEKPYLPLKVAKAERAKAEAVKEHKSPGEVQKAGDAAAKAGDGKPVIGGNPSAADKPVAGGAAKK